MYLFTNCQVLIAQNLQAVDVLVTDGKITRVGSNLAAQLQAEDETALIGIEVIDGRGKVLAPGFIDVHVHWREPGFSYKETIRQASQAAARGGFTTAMPMPNLNPVPDSLANLKPQLEIIAADSCIRAIPYGAITKGEQGKEFADFAELADYVFAFSDDGRGVQDAAMMYESMQVAAKLGKAVVAHCEENSLIYGGCMHCGQRAKELGLPGIPSVCESVQIARDVLLAEAAGCHYHVCHLSTKESVRVVRDAKAAGIKVTAEVCPHHLVSNEHDITHDHGNWKMNPPLRATDDQQALIEGLLDGTIDLIATDHAPHAPHEKNCSMTQSAFGIVGSEFAFSQLYTAFVKTGKFSLPFLLHKMSTSVAETFNLPYGKIAAGYPADLVLLDLEASTNIDPEAFYSKGRNTPYGGQVVFGLPVLTLVEGKVVYDATTGIVGSTYQGKPQADLARLQQA